jgi:hypothetical protein
MLLQTKREICGLADIDSAIGISQYIYEEGHSCVAWIRTYDPREAD